MLVSFIHVKHYEHFPAFADFVLPSSGCTEKVPDGAQEQRGEFGEVPGRAEETAQEEPRQQTPLEVWRQGDAGQPLCVCVRESKRIFRCAHHDDTSVVQWIEISTFQPACLK